MKSNVNVVILAAGLGTRMKSDQAKVLHEAGGDTLLNQVIRAARQVAPSENIVVVVGYQAEKVKNSVRATGIRFAEQHEQKGTGHAVLCAEQAITSKKGRLLILNGDGPLLRGETLLRLLNQEQTTLPAGREYGGALLTTNVVDPTGYGRILRDPSGMIAAIVEQKAATAEQQKIREINPGVYCFEAKPFWQHASEITPNNAAKEYYLTDMVEILSRSGHAIAPVPVSDETELLGINTRAELAVADKILRSRKTLQLMLAGITIENPDSVMIDPDVEVGQDTVLEPNVQLRGDTKIGARCRIGTGSLLRNCHLAEDVTVYAYVVAEDSHIAKDASVGPFARLRMGATAQQDSRIGNFVELKKTTLGRGSKAQHLAYLGDAAIGANVNIGAGTITCNFDGQQKHQTLVGENAFVGSNSTLVAPLQVSDGSYVAAGSVITKDVAADALAIGRAHQVSKEGWAKRRRNQLDKKI